MVPDSALQRPDSLSKEARMIDPENATVEDVHRTLGIGEGLRYVRAPVFAESIGLDIRSIERFFVSGKLHRHRIGKIVFVDLQEAAALLAQRAASVRGNRKVPPPRPVKKRVRKKPGAARAAG